MKIKYYGHSCFSVEIKGKHLLFDPFISPNPLAAHIDVNQIAADYILVSHGHEDHVADVLSIAERTGAQVISNFEIIQWFKKQGLSNLMAMNFGGAVSFDFGLVKLVHAVHSSSMPDGSYGGNPGGFVVESEEGNFYYAGDTSLHIDMQLTGLAHKINFAFLPIGDLFTMGLKDAAMAAEFVRCKRVIAMHYDTFPPIQVDKNEAITIFKENRKNLLFFEIGETKEI